MGKARGTQRRAGSMLTALSTCLFAHSDCCPCLCVPAGSTAAFGTAYGFVPILAQPLLELGWDSCSSGDFDVARATEVLGAHFLLSCYTHTPAASPMAHTLPWLAIQHSLVLSEFLILPPHPSPPGPCLCMLPDFSFPFYLLLFPNQQLPSLHKRRTCRLSSYFHVVTTQALNSQGLHRLPRL